MLGLETRIDTVITLYDADRCPYCARVRIVLAEKGIEYETVGSTSTIAPSWIYEKNPLGRVPVLEEDTFVLPESAVINEYLEERYPEPALWPADPGERSFGRLLVFRFDELLAARTTRCGGARTAPRSASTPRSRELDAVLEARPYLSGRDFGLADIAYVPWIVRARDRSTSTSSSFPAVSRLARAADASGRRSRPRSTSSRRCDV